MNSGQGIRMEAKQTVGIIFQNQHMLTHANLRNALTPLKGQGHASRVLEIRNSVEEFNGAAGQLQAPDRLFQGLGNQAIFIQINVNDISLASTETSQSAHIRRRLSQHDVTGVNEKLCHQVQGLL